jgi:hypothetical protein
MTTRITSENDLDYSEQPARRSVVPETKSAFKTTELVVYVLAVLGVLIAAAVTNRSDGEAGFDAQHAWLYVTLLTVGYLISRGLAKSGSGNRNDA